MDADQIVRVTDFQTATLPSCELGIARPVLRPTLETRNVLTLARNAERRDGLHGVSPGAGECDSRVVFLWSVRGRAPR